MAGAVGQPLNYHEVRALGCGGCAAAEIAPGQVACAIRVTAGMATVSSSACAHDAHAAWGDPDDSQESSRLTAGPRAIVETAAARLDRLRTRLPSAARACLVTRIAPATCPGALTTAADRSRTASAGKVVAAGRWTSRVSRVRRETHPEALRARRHRFATAGRACWLPTLIGAVGRGTRGAVLQRQDNRRRMRFPRDGHGRSDTTLPALAPQPFERRAPATCPGALSRCRRGRDLTLPVSAIGFWTHLQMTNPCAPPRPSRWLGLFIYGLFAFPALARADGALQLPSPDGHRVVGAVEARAPITIDGALDEQAWRDAQPAGDFIQAEPHEGEAASEPTDVRIVYDHDALYIGVVCHDAMPSALVVNDIRKDFTAGEQDSFEVILDTFADRRNGFVFVVNPAGAKSDTQIANEGRDVNTSWDAVWTVATTRNESGWTAEIRIPFKTLRFERGADRIWGVNFSRRIRRKNEIDYWSPVPRVYNLYRAGMAGTLSGLPDASQGRNLRLKPWIGADLTRGVGGERFDRDGEAGLDVKYGVTPSLTLDVTVKPDFAQAEADEQQVNLTQFSLFFPEKREFFLENSGMFYFGDIPRESRLGNARFSPPEEEMLLFFSRRIGLTDRGEEIPIIAGGRLTGRVGRTGVGAMTIQTQDVDGRAGDNYTVLRGRRDILRNSDVGAIFLSRQSSDASSDRNQVAGVDANFRFRRALSLNGFLAKSATPDVAGGEMAGKGSVVWNDNFLHTQYSLLSVGDNFRDDIGFIK